jgi:hypothetical protein
LKLTRGWNECYCDYTNYWFTRSYQMY